MFSGIVEEVGTVTQALHQQGKSVLTFAATKCLEGIQIGDSIAVNGTCLTVVAFDSRSFTVEVIWETLKLTNLKNLQTNSLVNLERSVTLLTRIGGHCVQGHIDGTTNIVAITPEGDSLKITFAKPPTHAHYFIPKGYIAIDGMSLTLAEVGDKHFSICVIPHTRAVTVAKQYAVGTSVHYEIDPMTKSVAQMCAHFMKEYTQHA